jgi:methyl-accepting chemotaxis protein
VDEMRRVSESSIVACGRALNGIVTNAREMAECAERNMRESLSATERAAAEFAEETQADISAQEERIEAVVALTGRIDEAVEAMTDLNRQTRLIGINANIEAARLGEQGRAFGVIAGHLQEFSKTMAAATKRVEDLIGAVRNELPVIAEQSTQLHEKTRGFVGSMEQQVKQSAEVLQTSATNRGGHLGNILQLSNTAISSLSFQDPLSQSLAHISRSLEEMQAAVEGVLAGNVSILAPAEEADGDDAETDHDEPAAAAGEMLLF